MGAVRFQVLGPLTAVLNGEGRNLGGPRQRMVLAVLLAHANQVVSQDALIDAVWAGSPPEAAKTTLHSYVSHLRRELGDGLVRQGDGYRVVVDDGSLDALHFERLVDEGRRMLDEDPDAAREVLEEGLRLWYGNPYGDLGGEPSLTLEVARLEELRLAAVEHRIEADLAAGNHRGVVGELETLVRDYPFRERLHGMLMLALYRSGRQAEALRAYQRTRTMLGEELGIEPSSELRELEQRILEQDPDLDLAIGGFADRASPPDADRSPRRVGTEAARTVRGYELREPIGEGDYGVVYRAFQPAVGREVALKAIRPEHVNRPAFVRRFETEAQLVAQLEHPHIAALYDYWRDPEGAYLVMPLLRGGSLKEALQRGPWNLAPALRLLDQVGSSLGYAHRQGVIHRDIKPGNVLLDEEGNAYLSDFGVAARMVDEAGTPVTTSLGYIPPEEILGEPLTARSDIFSLGVLAFHLLTGIAPTGHHPLPSLADARPDLPMELGEAVRQATDPDPANRYNRAEDFLRAVRRAVGSDVVAISEPAEPPPDTAPVRNPYKGLRAFMETDALDFYGRDALIDEMLRAVGSQSVVAVVGPSGSGKSSVVRAGLVPALRAGGLPGSRGWLITDMFPGTYPFEELEAALLRVATERPLALIDDLTADDRGLVRVSKQILPSDDSQLVLIIDQFEEMFSMVRDEATRRLFLDGLTAVGSDRRSRVKVLLTLRADFFDRPLEYPEFGEILKEGLVAIGPPSEEGLAQAIAAPARGVGVELEPGLVGRIISDVEGQPGGLPLLQYALTELFNRREGDRITIDSYEATGGVRGALGQRAEEIYQELPVAGKKAARQLFLRLVTVDEAADDTRRRVRQTELKTLAVDQGALDQVLHPYGSFRLLSFDRDPVTRGPTVEVAHEALLGEWERLRAWIDSQREDLLLHRRLNSSAQEWVESERDPSFLLRGGRLEQAERWAERSGIALAGDEEEYLAASKEQREAEAAAARRRRRISIWSLVAALLVVSTLAGLALWQRGIAHQETRQETVRQLVASSALALEEDPERAILLALEAAEISRRAGEAVRPEVIAALHRAVQTSRLEQRIDGWGAAVAFSPDGSLLARGSLDSPHEVVVQDTATGDHVTTLSGEAQVIGAAFSPDGSLLAVGYFYWEPGVTEFSTVVWELASGRAVQHLSGGGALLTWSPDGEVLLAQRLEADEHTRMVTTWEVASGVELFSTQTAPTGGSQFPFIGPRTVLITMPDAEAVGFYDVTTGEEIDRLDTPGFIPGALALDRKRNVLFVGSYDSVGVQAWDLESRSLRWSDFNPGVDILEVHQDAGLLAVAGWDGMIRLLDIEDGSELTTPLAHTGEWFSVAFHPDGDRLFSVGDGARVWDVARGGPAGTVDLGSAIPFSIAVSPQGDEVAVQGVTVLGRPPLGTLQRFDLATGELLGELTGHIHWESLHAPVSPDWRLMAALDQAGQGWIRDLSTGEPVAELPPCTSPVTFSPDGSALLLNGLGLCPAEDVPAGAELRSRVIEVPSGRELLDLGEVAVPFPNLATFNPAGVFPRGRYLAVIREGVQIYDMLNGELVASPVEAASIAFDPTGKYLVVTGGGFAGVLDFEAVVSGSSTEEALVFERTVDLGLVPGVALNADGVLATSALGSLRLWDINTGGHLIDIPVDIELPPFAAFSPDGRYLFYGDGTEETGYVVRRFPLDPDELIALAESRVTRGFTPDECDRYSLDC